MAKNLAGLNYDSKLNIDDLTFQSDETEKAILDRTTIVFGTRALSQPRYGIIDLLNTRNIISSETSRPLLVYASITNSVNINITPGSAVTPNGSIVSNSILIEDMELARTAANDINIVFIENEIVDAPPVRKTRYNVDQYTRRIQSSEVIRVSLLSDYQNDIIFPPTRRSNIVVLAVITVVQTATSEFELHFDYSNSVYTFNRPWYSPVDIEHRSLLGGGIATETNPHGLTYNDLVSGNLTLYDQLLDVGQILARDDVVKGVCGTPCFETIEVGRVLTDDMYGTVTSASRFGGSGAKYIELASYPVKVTAFYLSNHIGRDIAFDLIPGTKLLVLPSPEALTSTATIWYNQVYALLPPVQVLSNNLSFSQPDQTKELILTGGIALSQLTNQFVDFDGSGPIPRNYTLYVTSSGDLLKSPQPIQTPIILDDIGTLITPISATIFGASKISVGLAGANPVSSMEVQIKLFGRDIDDNDINETIIFSGTTWQTTTSLENPNQYILSSNIFTVLTAIQVISRTSDGPSSKIQLWAELETGTTLELNKLAKVASLLWDGVAIKNLKDRRQISKVLPTPINRFYAASSMAGLGGTNPRLVYCEDFLTPLLRNTTAGSQTAIASTVRIKIADFHGILNGDIITMPNGKVLTAVDYIGSTPSEIETSRSFGKFLRAGSNQDTRNELITTMNYSGFSSGYSAVADTSLGDGVALVSALVLGARSNGSISTSVVLPRTSIQFVDSLGVGVSVMAGGIDNYKECFLPKHANSIDTAIPNISTYDVTSYRNRYVSVALPISPSIDTVRVIIHGVPPLQTNIQLRVRIAGGTDPEWMPWEVISGDGASFTITKGYFITKIQLEIFGKASGFSVYEV
jgi:hypothetical protein